MVPSHLDIEKLLTGRLEDVRKEKSALKEKIELWEGKLKDSKRLAGNAPKESENDIQQQISQLERQYATTSQSKAEERKVLFEIEKLKQKKKLAINYSKYSGDIEMLRNQLSIARAELLEKETAIDELSSGLRKVKLAARAGCNSSELIESVYEVDSSKLPQIVGKGGMNIRSLESDFGVTVDVDHVKGNVRITGTPISIQNAYEAMTIIMDTVSEEFQIKYETIGCLMMEKLALLHDIQSKYGVRIEVNQTKGVCKIMGLTSQVDKAKKDILMIPSCRLEMSIDKGFVPTIIGKGGANIRSIGGENRVIINISRDDDVVEVVGLKNDVQNAVEKIKNLVDENREVEVSIPLERHILLGCFVTSSSANIRSIAKEFNVRIDTQGEKEDRAQIIKIKGINSKVQPAKSYVQSLIENYRNQSHTVEVSDEIIPAVLGKGGIGIKAMREKYPGANIDIDGGIIHIHSSSPSVRKDILDEIHAIIGENYMESMITSESFAIMLKTPRCSELRDKFTKELNIKMSIEKDNLLVKLKGSQANVKKGMESLQELQNNYVVQTIAFDKEDYPVLLKSGDESVVRTLSDKFEVDITVNKKELNLTIRGRAAQVQAVAEFIQGFLNGNVTCGSQILKLDNLVSPAFIGKSGANVKKLEEELEVEFDILKSRGLLRIRGDAAKLPGAKLSVSRFLLGARVTDSCNLDVSLSKSQIEEISRKTLDIFSAEVEVKDEAPNVIIIRSAFQVLQETKQFVNELVSGYGIFSLPLLNNHIATLKSMTDYGLGKFKGKFTIEILNNCVQLKGESSKLSYAKRDFMRAVHAIFPTEAAFIEISRACIRDIVNAELLLAIEGLHAIIQCDRMSGFLWLVCPEHNLCSAQLAVEAQLSPWKALNASIKIDEFMIPLILGKNGTIINALRKELDCGIELDRTALTMDIKCTTTESLNIAMALLQQRVEKMRLEHFETKIPLEFVPLLIGKQGSNINKFRTETGVQIDVDPKLGIVTLTGSEAQLPEAKRRLIAFIEEEEKYRTLPRSFYIPALAFPVLIGAKGVTIRELQEKSGAKIDLNRDLKKCTLRGRNEDCERAFDLINEILELEGHKPISRIESKHEVDGNDDDGLGDVFGDKDELQSSIPRSQLSKSALKRLRKKQRQTRETASQEEEFGSNVDEECNESDYLQERGANSTVALAHSAPVDTAPVTRADPPTVILPPFSILPETDPIIDGLQLKTGSSAGIIGQSSPATHQTGPQDLVNFLLGKDNSSLSTNTMNPTNGAKLSDGPSASRLAYANNLYPTAPSLHDVMFSAPVFGISTKALNVPPPGLSPATAVGSSSSSHAPSIAGFKYGDSRIRRDGSNSVSLQFGNR